MTRPHVVVLVTLARLGGAERSLVEIVRRLGDELRFTLVMPEDGPLRDVAHDAGAETRIVPWPEALATLGERARRRGRAADLVRAALAMGALHPRLAGELVRLRPDVLVTNGIKAHLLGALLRPALGVPLVWYAREGLEDRPRSRLALRLVARRCDGVVAISRYVANELRSIVPGPAPVHVVRNIVDLARVRPKLALPDDLAKPVGELWFGVVGALTPLKGQDVFLDAAASIAAALPQARFLVVGGEPYRTQAQLGFGAALRERARVLGLGDRVRFLGERDDAPAIIANLDVLVQPNRGPEGLGRAILEAFACGVPVVSVDRWGPRELVADGDTGLVAAPGDVAAFADRMRRLAIDPTLRAQLGISARRWINTHGDPARLATAFRDALVAIARLETSRADDAGRAGAHGRAPGRAAARGGR